MAAEDKDNGQTRSFTVLVAGVEVSHYKIISKIGSGGMGEVYLAEDTKLKRRVALKFLPENLCRDHACRARFKREAQATAKLDHPNVVTIYEVSEFQGRPYFAMQYVSEISLKDYMAREKLSLTQIVEITIDICRGLSAAHQAGIIHRDIKPANILIDDSGNPKIVDFGLAHVVGATKLTKTGSTLGTVHYMSPEQVQGKEVDQRSDLFSLGAVLYELITGRTPFERDIEAATLKAIVDDNPEPLTRYKTDIPDELQRTVSKLIEKDSSMRYQSAAGVISDLKRLVRSSQSAAAVSGFLRRKHLKRVTVAVVALVAGLIIVFGYYLFYQARLPQRLGITDSEESRWGNSIAVLPFRDFSPNKDQEYFCDGMTDAIIGKLSGVADLKVISMSSVMRYRAPDRNIKKIGADLQVNTILEGTIQREDSRIRLRAELISVADDAHLWSQTYDRELSSVFAIQDDISHAIVDAMKIKLLGEDTTFITRRHTENIEAYNFYMRGRHLWSKRTERDLRKAIEYFEEAIALDSNYALAYSGLADAWSVLPGYLDVLGAVTLTEALANARVAAKKAIRLDENLAEAHASLGLIHHHERDWEGAEKAYLRAIELNPGYFWAHYWYSLLLRDMARYPEQIHEQDIAFELNPMSIPLILNRAERKSQTFEWQEAEELYRRLIEIEPNRWKSYIGYANLLAYSMGRNEDAVSQCSLAVQMDKTAYSYLAYIYEWTGNLDKALWAANMYIESVPDKHDAYDTRGEIYALSGMLDSAIVSFKKALEIKPDFATTLRKLGNVYMFQQEYAKAESLYQILASHPNKETRANGRLYLTQIPLHQGRLKEGLRMLDRLKDKAVADSLSGFFRAYGSFKRGWIYWDLNDQESAISEFEKVLKILKEIEPNNSLVAMSRGCIAYSSALSGDLDTADQLLRDLDRDIKNYGPEALDEYWTCVGQVEMQRGNFDTAVVCFERLVQLDPKFGLLWSLAQSYLGAGRLDEAIAVFEKIRNRYDGNRAYWPTFGVRTYYYLGRAYETAGRYDDAIEEYETFLHIWKNADEGIKSVDDARKRLVRLKNKT